MEIYELIDALEEIAESSAPIPMTGKCLVNREQVLELTRQLRLKLPDEIKDAAKIKEDKDNIIKKAESEAQRILKGADAKFSELVDQHEIISAAYKKHNEIISAAQLSAHDIKKSAYEYVDKLLARAESLLGESLGTVSANRREIESFKG
jgi:cell division septum initiation protein DivIVA